MSKKKLSLIPPDENHTYDMFNNRIEKKEGDLTPSAQDSKDIQLFERMFSFWWLTVFENRYKKLLPSTFQEQKDLYAYCFEKFFRKKLSFAKTYVIKHMYLVPGRLRGLSKDSITFTFTYLINSFESNLERNLKQNKEEKQKTILEDKVFSNKSLKKTSSSSSLTPKDKKDIEKIIVKGAVNKDVEAVVKSIEQTPVLQRLWNSVRGSWDSLFSKKGGTRKCPPKM
jgi:hypothetical protein